MQRLGFQVESIVRDAVDEEVYRERMICCGKRGSVSELSSINCCRDRVSVSSSIGIKRYESYGLI